VTRVRCTTTPGGQLTVLDSRNSSSQGVGLNVDTDAVQCWVNGTDNASWDFTSAGLAAGRWTQVACTDDGSRKTVWLDGVEVQSNAYSGSIYWSTTGPLFLPYRAATTASGRTQPKKHTSSIAPTKLTS